MYPPTAMRYVGRSACGLLRLRGANCCVTGESRWLDVFTSPLVNRAKAGSVRSVLYTRLFFFFYILFFTVSICCWEQYEGLPLVQDGISKETWCLTSTETIRLIRDGVVSVL